MSVTTINTTTGLYPEYLARGVHKINIIYHKTNPKQIYVYEELDQNNKPHGKTEHYQPSGIRMSKRYYQHGQLSHDTKPAEIVYDKYGDKCSVMYFVNGRMHNTRGVAYACGIWSRYALWGHVVDREEWSALFERKHKKTIMDALPQPIYEEMLDHICIDDPPEIELPEHDGYLI